MKVKLQNVRLLFPNLFEPRAAEASQKPKFSATFAFAPGSAAEKAVLEGMKEAATEKWNAKAPEIFKALKAANRLVLHDGAEKAGKYDGFEGQKYINASNEMRPPVVDGLRNPLTVADGKPYAGCYVNAMVDIWAQDNKYGQRINASLMGVQFLKDGDRLSGGGVASEEEFEEIPEAAVAPAGGGGSATDDVFGSSDAPAQESTETPDPFA